MNKISTPFKLIKDSFNIFFEKKNLLLFLKVVLIVIVVTYGSSYLLSQDPLPSTIFWTSLKIALGILILTLFVWSQAIVYESVVRVIDKKNLALTKIIKSSFKKLWMFFLVNLIYWLLVVVGVALLIVPGVVIATWFAFARLLVIKDKLGVKESLKQSKSLVKGRFWPILGRLFVFVLFSVVVEIAFSLLPFDAGSWISVFLSPLFLLPYYLLLRELTLPEVIT
ncbi:hypothetical protein ACFL1Q_02650 [Patescibacteria group bacterium]